MAAAVNIVAAMHTSVICSDDQRVTEMPYAYHPRLLQHAAQASTRNSRRHTIAQRLRMVTR